MKYEPNEKHKSPWQPGRKGSLCPTDLPEAERQGLLAQSEPDPAGGKARYATRDGRAFCGYEHAPDTWHGFPVGWKEVPERLRHGWVASGAVRRRDIRRFWESSEDPS